MLTFEFNKNFWFRNTPRTQKWFFCGQKLYFKLGSFFPVIVVILSNLVQNIKIIRFYSLRVIPLNSSLNFSFRILSLTVPRAKKKKVKKLLWIPYFYWHFQKNGCISWNIDFQSSRVSNSESTTKNTLEKTIFKILISQMSISYFLVPRNFILFFEIDLSIFWKLFLTLRYFEKIFFGKMCF